MIPIHGVSSLQLLRGQFRRHYQSPERAQVSSLLGFSILSLSLHTEFVVPQLSVYTLLCKLLQG
jgi:hypothetical protein